VPTTSSASTSATEKPRTGKPQVGTNAAQRYAPFVYDAWKNPETLKIVSQVAGVDLVTQMDFEIGHINISVKSAESSEAELLEFHRRSKLGENDDVEPIVGWHTDSYPFVCVTMLSDCTNMVGGETALRTGSGDILKVRGPQMVRLSLFLNLRRLSPLDMIQDEWE
jgi:hypothetical protein